MVVGQKIRWVLEMMRGPELAGARITRVDRRDLDDHTVEFTFHDAAPGEPELDLEATKETLLALGEAGAAISIRQRRAPVRDVVVAAGRVPGFGWRTYRAVEGEGPSTEVRASGHELANEHVRVVVDPADGTLTIEADGVTVQWSEPLRRRRRRWRHLQLLPTCGRHHRGTTRRRSPSPSTSPDRYEPGSRITATYSMPTHALGDERSCSHRSPETTTTEIVTTLELRTGERFLRVHVELDHRVRDHRLRAHFPLPAPVDGSTAECAFALVRRGLTAEGGPHEYGLPTFVSRRFVDCSANELGLALLHDGLLEYEVTRTARACTDPAARHRLSVALRAALRPNPAGPLDPLEGPQLQGRRVGRLRRAPPPRRCVRRASLPAAADEFLLPLERVRGGGWPGAAAAPTGHTMSRRGQRCQRCTATTPVRSRCGW